MTNACGFVDVEPLVFVVLIGAFVVDIKAMPGVCAKRSWKRLLINMNERMSVIAKPPIVSRFWR
jgi:hypothetical protein